MRKPSIWLLTLLLAAPVAGCATSQRAGVETSLAKALISDEQSAQIGEQVHNELEQQGVRYLKDSTVNAYVADIAGKIFPLARKDRGGMDYHVHVIDEPKNVNAFATPGGHIYVYTGLLMAADNEAEVAGVMAHEAGHVAGRHIERAMVNAYGVQALASLALGQNPSLAKQLAASVAATGVMRAHGRSEETEADEYGARYASRAGYDPRAMITFFEKLQKQDRSTPRALAWLRTHPMPEDRIEHLKQYIRQNRLTGSNLGSGRHEEIVRRLQGSAPRA